MKVINYNKLVRDKIPEIIEKSGKKAIVYIEKGEKLVQFFNEKLQEELFEFLESGDIEELADIVEVIYGILHHKGISVGEFEEIRLKKNKTRGSFEKGIILTEVRE